MKLFQIGCPYNGLKVFLDGLKIIFNTLEVLHDLVKKNIQNKSKLY